MRTLAFLTDLNPDNLKPQIDMEVEDEDVVDEAAQDNLHEQLDRLRDLTKKFTSQVSRLDGLDVSLERVETAATALGIVQQVTF
jgi:hypothetical protein